jgi:ketosteroid isomerase-like protein
MTDERELFTRVYAAFNARDIETILAALHPDVDWPNGWEGGRLEGRDAVRDYWTRQWAAIDPSVEPVAIETDEVGRTEVTVRQIVRDLSGEVVSDGTVKHVYTLEDGLIRRMEIQPG